MTTPEDKPDGLEVLFKPLPELEGSAFTQSVLIRTRRIQFWRELVRPLTYLCASAVTLAALPWQSVIEALSTLSGSMTQSAELSTRISMLSNWLQANISFYDTQTQQIVVIAAIASVLGGVISLAITEG